MIGIFQIYAILIQFKYFELHNFLNKSTKACFLIGNCYHYSNFKCPVSLSNLDE